MYYPIQIPYILNKQFSQSITYTEHVVSKIQDFAICMWEMESRPTVDNVIQNIIVSDGCVDLVVDYQTKQIGYSGMSKTDFHFEVIAPSHYFGIRFKPGAFYQLTNISAAEVMDNFISLTDIDPKFNSGAFFAMPFTDGKKYIENYLTGLIAKQAPSSFVLLFDKLSEIETPLNTAELYKMLNFSSRQCQRLFLKHYGISPKIVLSIIRFQQCLKILTSKDLKQSDIISMAGYYDQPHFIKDIKKNIGITPLELITKSLRSKL